MKYSASYFGLLITFLVAGIAVYAWHDSKMGGPYKIGYTVENVIVLMIIPCIAAYKYRGIERCSLSIPPILAVLGVFVFSVLVKEADVSIASFMLIHALFVQSAVYLLFAILIKNESNKV